MSKELTKDTLFETSRLRIRKLQLQDLNLFQQMQGNFNVMQFVAEKANSYEENIKDLEHVLECYRKQDNNFWVWAAERKLNDQFVGTIALILDKENNWEIGYRLLEEEWGNGYATEMVEGLITFCESIDEIDNLIAYADLRNVASQRVLSKTGFVNLGIKYNDEADCEDYIYSLNTSG